MDSSIRLEIQRLRRSHPFRPFVLTMDNGERIMINHPENIGFHPGSPEGVGASEDFCVISSGMRLFSTFNAITSVAVLDQGNL